MTASRILIGCWAALVMLSITTVLLAKVEATPLVTGLVLAVALAKALLISDGFMEMRHAPRMWRLLLAGWPLLVAVGVLLAML